MSTHQDEAPTGTASVADEAGPTAAAAGAEPEASPQARWAAPVPLHPARSLGGAGLRLPGLHPVAAAPQRAAPGRRVRHQRRHRLRGRGGRGLDLAGVRRPRPAPAAAGGVAGLRHLGRGRAGPRPRPGPVVAGADPRPHGRADAEPPAAGCCCRWSRWPSSPAWSPCPGPCAGLPTGSPGGCSGGWDGGPRSALGWAAVVVGTWPAGQRPAAGRAGRPGRPELLGPQHRHRRGRRAAHQHAAVGWPGIVGVLGVARPPGPHYHRDRPVGRGDRRRSPGHRRRSRSGPTPAPSPPRTWRTRAELAVADLERAGGFDRGNLLVATTTGSGWLDSGAIDSFEYLTGGDSAIVAMQYSYLPSWLVVPGRPEEGPGGGPRSCSTRCTTVGPGCRRTDRPRLFVFGLSLGSFGGETAVQRRVRPAQPDRRDAVRRAAQLQHPLPRVHRRPRPGQPGGGAGLQGRPDVRFTNDVAAGVRRPRSPGTGPGCCTCSTPPTRSSGGARA